MSDEENESPPPQPEPVVVKKRQEKPIASAGLEEADKELLANNRQERDRMDDEINELRQRNEKRKKEREIEEKRLASERSADDARRKTDEEDRKRKKEEDEQRKKGERAQKMAEFEKYKTPPKANFVISKKLSAAGGEEGEEGEGKPRKSKEQLEAEKRAIIKQRLKPLDIDGADNTKLTEKAKELHTLFCRLEGEKYDLEKRIKILQAEMQHLIGRSRVTAKPSKDNQGTVKRVGDGAGEDRIAQRYAGAPLKVEMFSKYERQKDKRTYDDRKVLYTGPMFGFPAEKIKPVKSVKWNEEGLPMYAEGATAPA
jgi:troponin T